MVRSLSARSPVPAGAIAVAACLAVAALVIYALAPSKPPAAPPVAVRAVQTPAPPLDLPPPPSVARRKPIEPLEAQTAAMTVLDEIPDVPSKPPEAPAPTVTPAVPAIEPTAPVVAKPPEPPPAPAPVAAPVETKPDPTVKPAVPDAARNALLDRREKAVEVLRASDLESRFAVIANLRLQLYELRLAAILAIADVKHYTHETGQPQVDKRVAAVRDFVKKYGRRGLPPLPASGRKRLDEIDACDGALAAFGVPPVADASVEIARRLARGFVTVETFSLPWEPQDLAETNAAVLKANLALRPKVPPETWELISTLNDYRILMGRHALAIDLSLVKAAHSHTDVMARAQKLDHFEADEARSTPDRRARLDGFKGGSIGENILVGESSARGAHDGWYHSAPHHRNMLRLSHTAVGVGHSTDYWTELFGHAWSP